MDTLTLSRIAHELRTPLAMIHSRLQLIEAEQPDMKVLKNWILLQENFQDMNNLITRLTETARDQAGLSAAVDLPQLLLELIDDFLLPADSANLCITLQVSPEAAPAASSLSCDRIHLKQIFTNLLKNAAEATEGLEKRIIKVDLSLVSSFLCVKIQDNGPGIPAHILPKLYMPYVTGKQYGTGIGLTITKQLIQEHGGWLEVENTPNGAAFLVYLRLPPPTIE